MRARQKWVAGLSAGTVVALLLVFQNCVESPAIDPPGPSNDLNPWVSGKALPNSRVSIYLDKVCTGKPHREGNADANGKFRIQIKANKGKTTKIYAKDDDPSEHNRCIEVGSYTHIAYTSGDMIESFGDDGAVFDADTLTSARDVHMLGDGSFLVAGGRPGGVGVAKYTSDGSLDASYGDGGVASFALSDFAHLPAWPGHFSNVVEMAAVGDQMLLLVSVNYGSAHQMALVRVNADGSLDTTYRGGGCFVETFDIQDRSGFSVRVVPTGMAVTADNYVLVAGSVVRDSSDYIDDDFVARFTPDGSLDPAFEHGIKRFDALEDMPVDVLDIMIDSQGRYVLAGKAEYSPTEHRPVLVRGDASTGALDLDFGSGGVAVMDYGDDAENPCNSAVSLSESRSGGYVFGGGPGVCLSRVAENGTLDASFGAHGAGYLGEVNGETPWLKKILMTRSGGIHAVANHGIHLSDFAVAKFTTEGRRDSTFGRAGYYTHDFAGQSDHVSGVAVDPDGKLLLVGTAGVVDDESGEVMNGVGILKMNP